MGVGAVQGGGEDAHVEHDQAIHQELLVKVGALDHARVLDIIQLKGGNAGVVGVRVHQHVRVVQLVQHAHSLEERMLVAVVDPHRNM